MPARASRSIVRLRVSLIGIEPEIWRTIDVDDSLTLAQLHQVLQIVFNWFDSHLHRFSEDDPWARSNGIPRIGRRPRAWVDAEWLAEGDIEGEEDEARTTVGEAMQHDGPLWYMYDMGDSWLHRIDLIDRDAATPGEPLAQLIIGERRAPFEDSGGITGHQEIADILADPSHPDYRSTKAWVATAVGPWATDDPEDPDLDGARGELVALFAPEGTDPSGLVDAATDVTADSPVAVFAAGLTAPLRSNLRRHLRRTGLLTPDRPRDEDVVDAVRPYAWLIERVGVDGLTLTKAGWMPPAAVLEGMATLGWRDEWIGEANREDLTYPMRELRASAEKLRLIRKLKGRIELVSRTRPAIGEPALLAERIGRMLLRQRMTDVERIAGTVLVIGLADGSITSRRDAERQVIEVVNELGYTDAQGRELDQRWFVSLTGPVLDALEPLGLWRSAGRRRDVPPTDGIRAIARLSLR